MSDAFPMPQTVAMPPPARDYAPKRGLAAVAEAIATDPPPYTQPNGKQPYAAPKHVDSIKEALKRLTHREMRELCAEIFKAHSKIGKTGDPDAIALGNLPDTLDAFAHGD